MKQTPRTAALALCALLGITLSAGVLAASEAPTAQLGPRPFFLVDDMDDGALKDALKQCEAGPFYRTAFSIGHRGAGMQFPEHTRESYLAAARMGAGIVECDVTFTKDRQLVCRHSQCDLHTTTDILGRPELAAKCTKPFTPADAASGTKADAMCCTSDLTLAEFKSLRGKMDAANADATTVEAYMDATPAWRTDLYATKGTLMTHDESIALFKELGVKFTPELKAPSVAMPFDGDYTQDAYAQQMIDEYKAAGVPAADVFAQSFQLRDILYWIKNDPEFGAQGVFLDDRNDTLEGFDPMKPETFKPTMQELADQGVKIIAPPTYMLVTARGRQDRALALRQVGEGGGAEDHHLDAGALRHAHRRRRLLLPERQGRHQQQRRHLCAARRPRQGRRRHRRLLRLAGDGDLLRQLHGPLSHLTCPDRERGGRGPPLSIPDASPGDQAASLSASSVIWMSSASERTGLMPAFCSVP